MSEREGRGVIPDPFDPLDPATGAAFYPYAAELHNLVVRLRGLGGDEAIITLLAAAAKLLPEYLVRFGSTPPVNKVAWARYITRLADPLSFHWLKWIDEAAKDGTEPPSLEEVVRNLQAGQICDRRVDGDVLADVCLAEGICQHDNGASKYFYDHYSGFIADTARRYGDYAVQELEGLLQDLVCFPSRLARFRGKSCLKAWLKILAYHELIDARRAEQRETPGLPDCAEQHAAGDPPSDGGDGEERLNAVAQQAVAPLTAYQVTLLKWKVLDGHTQTEIAKMLKVDDSTVSRQVQKAKLKMLEVFLACTGVMAGPDASATWRAVAVALGVTPLQLAEAIGEALRERASP